MTEIGSPSTDVQTILLVEDDKDIGAFLVEVLQDEMHHVALHVLDAIHALEAVKSIKPSLFMLDYHLPGINGLELSDRLNALEGLETVPTLLLSASPPPRNVMQQRHISFLAKPFELPDLLQAIEELLPAQKA